MGLLSCSLSLSLLDDSYLRANTTEGCGEGEGGEIGGEGETALALCAVQPEKRAFCWDWD